MMARLLLLAALVLTAAVYWIGLTGPFLFDDAPNLAPLQRWLAGESTWQFTLLDNQSGELGRPVSMASFMLSAAAGGYTPFPFKLTNLIIHLLCGLAIWQVVRVALRRDPRLSASAEWVATAVACLWLLHPLHASTVLYVVQRMAQLSALFGLLALWAFIYGRSALADGRGRTGLLALFVGFPLLWLLGLLSKENAAVVIGLCLVIELAWFADRPRPKAVLAFFGLFLVLPLVAAAALLTLRPHRFMALYEMRDFGPVERLLTQARALVDYIIQLLVPRSPRMGLYTDDFPVSTSLLAPATTLVSLLLLLAASIGAWLVRRRWPVVFAGWFFFLVAHAVESTVLPLEMYFEHRNYLPSVGLLLLMVGAFALLMQTVKTDAMSPAKLAGLVGGGLALVFAFATLGRAHVWQNLDTIAEQGVRYHPQSLRANLDLAGVAMNANRFDEAMAAMLRLSDHPDGRNRLIGKLGMVTLDCIRIGEIDPSGLDRAVADAQPRVTFAEQQAFELLAKVHVDKNCRNMTDLSLADAIDRTLQAASSQPDTVKPKWRTRNLAADLFARGGDWQRAQEQARLAWQPGADPAIGARLTRIYLENGRIDDAEGVLNETERRVSPYDANGVAELGRLRDMISQRRAAPAPAPSSVGTDAVVPAPVPDQAPAEQQSQTDE